MNKHILPDLQLFSEEQPASGETQAAPGQPQEQRAQAADAVTQDAAAKRMSWDELMRDPYYNAQMRSTVQTRLREAKQSQADMQTLAPALELLSQKYGVARGDHAALVQAVRNEGENQRKQQLQEHLASLEQQAQQLKKSFPDFDLRAQLQDPAFARLTAPGTGLSLEDAYYALNRQQLQGMSMQVAARQTARKLANAVASGSHRPREHGANAQATSLTSFDYRLASREQREALKQQIRLAAARGEKIYPG
jgi:hypothetical protein